MSGLKGYPSQQKQIKTDGVFDRTQQSESEFVTVQPTDAEKRALDTTVRFAFRVTGAVDAVESGSTRKQIVATAHGARVGDFLRFESAGANQYFESTVIRIIDANTLILGNPLPVTPTVGDQFYLLRYATQRVDSTGAQTVVVAPSPIAIVLDGVDTSIEEDTTDPNNDVLLPVKEIGKQAVDLIQNVYSSDNVSDVAYTEILASTSARSDFMTLFDGGGYAMILAFGGVGSEVDKLYIPPGGFNGIIPFYIPAGTRLSLKCLEVGITVNNGIMVMNTLRS